MPTFRVHKVRFYDPRPEAIHCMTYLENGKKLALSRSGGQIEIWNCRPGYFFQEKIIPPEFGQSIESLVWCQGRLFSVGLNGIILEYDLVNLKVKSSTPTSFGACWCMSPNEANTHLAVGTEDGYVLVFELHEDELNFSRSLDKQEGRNMCLSWHESGDFLATGSEGSVRLWDTKTGSTRQRINIKKAANKKPAVVWCIKLSSDFQIICGDSTGYVSIIDAHSGAVVTSIQSHIADVLCLAFEECGTVFYASGVDPVIVRFERFETFDGPKWMKSIRINHQTHDVRAMSFVYGHLISVGVSAEMVLSKKGAEGKYAKILPYPHQPCVQVARQANCILLQYPTDLEVWKLGTTSETSDEDSKSLNLSSNELKLVHMKPKENEVFVCSTISDDGLWLSYATNQTLRVFQLQMEFVDSEITHVTLHKVRFVPKECSPSLHLKFSPDASRLYSLLPRGDVQVLGVDLIQISFINEIESPEPLQGCHLMSVSGNGEFIAVGSHSGQVFVYETTTFQKYAQAPKLVFQPTALTFLPGDNEMAIAYETGKVIGFDLQTKAFSRWSRNLQVYPGHKVTLRGITGCPAYPNKLLCYDVWHSYLIDMEVLARKGKRDLALQKSYRYRHLLDFSSLNDNYMVAVIVPPLTLGSKIAPTLKKKKFRN